MVGNPYLKTQQKVIQEFLKSIDASRLRTKPRCGGRIRVLLANGGGDLS